MKTRIDNAMTELNIARSRTSAQNIIKEGKVTVNGKTVSKPSEIVDTETDKIEIIGNPECTKYVGRGGFKLEKAINEIEKNIGVDIAEIDIKDAAKYLGEIIGEEVTADVINKIFEKFCLGK